MQLDQAALPGFFEIHAENYFGDGGPRHRQLTALLEKTDLPLSVHGVGLSLGGATELNNHHLTNLKNLIDRYQPQLVSEHVAWCGSSAGYLNDLLPVPYTEEALTRLCDHIDQTQDLLGRSIAIENPSTYLTFKDADYSEADFMAEACRRSGAKLLLDVNNILVNARNHDLDAEHWIAQIPAGPENIVSEIHLAGHSRKDVDGITICIDDHGSEVEADCWALYETALGHFGPTPSLIEWDSNIPNLDILMEEARTADRLQAMRKMPFLNRSKALAANFPTIRQLVGEEFFNAMAARFIPDNLPKDAALFRYGDALPAFLEKFPPTQGLLYLPDVARLDFACVTALHTADADPLPLDALQTLPPEQLAGSKLGFLPSLQILDCTRPADLIRAAHTSDSVVDLEEIDLTPAPRPILVWRADDQPLWQAVSPALRDLIAALEQKSPFGSALETITKAHPAEDGPQLVADLVGPLGKLIGDAIALLEKMPLDVIQLFARIGVGGVFLVSGLTKVTFDDGIALSSNAIFLFQEYYKVPLLEPEVAAWLAVSFELTLPWLLFAGLGARASAAALLGMTVVIQFFVLGFPNAWQDHALWTSALLLILCYGPGDGEIGLADNARITWSGTGDLLLLGPSDPNDPYWTKIYIIGADQKIEPPITLPDGLADAYIVEVEAPDIPPPLLGSLRIMHLMGITAMPEVDFDTLVEVGVSEFAERPDIGPTMEQGLLLLGRPEGTTPQMVNFLRYLDRARYADGDRGLTGEEAYGRYGAVAAPAVYATGGELLFYTKVTKVVQQAKAGPTAPPPGWDQNTPYWHSIAAMQYSEPKAIMTMPAFDWYAAGLEDRDAGVDATRTLIGVELELGAIFSMMGLGAVATASFLLIGFVALKILRQPSQLFLPSLTFPNCGNMGLPLCLLAFGDEGLALAIGFFSVTVLSNTTIGFWISQNIFSLKDGLRAPHIYAVALAILVQAFDVGVPLWISNTTDLIGAIAIPLMLVTLGVSIADLKVRDIGPSVGLGVLRLMMGAGIGLGLAILFDLEGVMRGVLIIQCAMPAAVLNYLFALRAELEGRADAHLQDGKGGAERVAGVVIASTLLSFVSLPILLIIGMDGAGQLFGQHVIDRPLPGCEEPATNRAPKKRDTAAKDAGDYYWFCLKHVREFNAKYDFFDGMSDEEVKEYQASAHTWHRPTWKFGDQNAADGTGAAAEKVKDGFGLFDDGPSAKTSGTVGEERPSATHYPKATRRALAQLNLDETASLQDVKTRYKDLVRRFHPDTNGGDRSMEARLQQVIQAYNHLNKSGFGK
ncbi:unnamed protein product [Symbiodinium microadriaticum]|nr:unnamed protein product [Symbiodinium microadriaticum]